MTNKDDKTTDETVGVPTTTDPMKDFAKIIADGVAAGIAANTRRKVPFGQYDPRSPFRTDKVKAPKLIRESYSNGIRLDPAVLFDKEIELLNKVRRSGRYLDRLVEVILNTDSADEYLDIRWPCHTADQKMAFKDKARSFLDLLQQIADAQDAEDEVELEKETRPRTRHFGDNKAFRDAKERAGA